MVNREVVLQTIKKMYESGIEDSVIEATLKDIGLSEEDAAQYISEVKGGPPAKAEPTEEEKEEISEKTASMVKAHLDEERAERDLKETTQHVYLEEQRSKIEGVEKGVGDLHAKVESLATPGNSELATNIAVIEKRIGGLEKRVADLKAINTATKELMEKVLESNHKILTKL